MNKKERDAIKLRVRRANNKKSVPYYVTHGLDKTYSYWGCRCVECKAGHAKAVRESYARRNGNGD